jgi:HlyD family type I secretion membrane fusion protein
MTVQAAPSRSQQLQVASVNDLIDLEDIYAENERANPRRWRGAVWLGFGVIFVFFGIFGVWAALAPLGSGAIANGQLQVDTNQKTVQHLEGGIIRKIYVRDGDMVQEGQVLVELDGTRSRTEFQLLEHQYLANRAVEARLIAERENRDRIALPRELESRENDGAIAEVIENQWRLFENRRNARISQIALLERRIAQSRQEIIGLSAQQTADRRQLELISEEIVGVRELYEKGLERKPRLLALERSKAQLEGSIGNRNALIARAEQAIAETEYQRVNLVEQAASEVETQLREVQAQLADVGDKLKAATEVLGRTQIRAPQSGRVYGLRFHTDGGVISPGEPIMGIVPEGDDLIVQVSIDPTDIDVVKLGAEASVRLTSFSQRSTKPINGRVIQISADLIKVEGKPPYYEARIELDRADTAQHKELALMQGMPAMAVISTGDQTLLEYLVAPLVRGLDKALRED